MVMRPEPRNTYITREQVLLAEIRAATNQLQSTVKAIDQGAARLQRWSLSLAWASLAIAVAALVVAIIK